MFKQSFYIVSIQIIGIILGFMSIYLVAGDMGPEIYSLVGVHAVVLSLIGTFSHLGIETTMMRETLYWMDKGNVEKVKEYTTQSILSRIMGFLILLPFVLGYLLYLFYAKYNRDYFFVLFSFYIGSCASALNDSMSLIVRSQGEYVFSQAARTVNGSITKFLAIFVYMMYGAIPYLFFYCLIPMPLMLIFLLKIRKYLSFEYLNISETIAKIKDSKNLWLRSYMDYFSNFADTFLVSLLFPPVLIGVYTLYKNFEGMVKMFIEGFFDVIFQQFVKFKGNVNNLLPMERKSNLTRWGAIVLILLLTIIYSVSPTFWVELMNLSKYDNIEIVLYILSVISILYLLGKNEINLIALFAPTAVVFKIGMAIFILTIFSFVLVTIFPTIYGVLIQRVFIFASTTFISIFLYRKNRLDYFSNIYQ